MWFKKVKIHNKNKNEQTASLNKLCKNCFQNLREIKV